jgi:hypothetical protein
MPEFELHMQSTKNSDKIAISNKLIKVLIATDYNLALVQYHIYTFIRQIDTSHCGICATLCKCQQVPSIDLRS